ncbi:hypothetical protein ARALYDRAFT_328389 [Arabidopsis lyrata subsp. lyrata]|uniref:PPM-type phosphatase domain-containing protein n=1 Tax=Arabidopsis lyrata subsp. lyrata TaxID=81972 RepID=D7M8Q5_ARALL|nr:hypothetical protein ARALYDRAFT_328389 [Arabidopsis lyrata subsp. lyrata]
MADHIVLSLQAPRFLIFPCSLHRSWRFPGYSVPEFRFSSQLQLANSISPSKSPASSSSPCPPENSAPEKFDLVSSTQLKDGSHVFRFGDASEIEKYLEAQEKARCVELEKQNAKIAEEASELSRKQGKKLVTSNIEISSEKEETAPSNLSNVIKIKRVRSPTKKKKETVNVSQSEDKVDAKIASVSNLSSIVSVAEAIPTSSTEEEEEVVVSEPINEKEITAKSYNAEPLSSQVMENVSVNKIGDRETNGYQRITENRMEVQAIPSSSSAQQEVVPVSTIEIDDNLNVREKPVKTIEAEENLVAKLTATAAVSPDELVSTSEATDRSVDEIAQKPVIDTSEENLKKTFEAEKNLVVEPTATAAVSSDELISTSEAIHHSVDEIAQKPVIDTSEENPMKTPVEPEATHCSIDEITEKPVVDTSDVENDGENVASTIEDEITVRDDNGSISKTADDTKGEDLQLPVPETASLEPIEVASDRLALAGREDAYFISHHNWIGIADGVSEWSFEGINKGMYAQELMSNCEKIISDEADKISDPVQVLHRSVNETKSSGSSTALIAHLDNNELHIANIGDSGFMVIREGTVFQKSSPMFHHFCFPLHIRQGDDVLKHAEVYHVILEEGDVVIAATDGLFDNLYEKEIVSIVCRSLEQSLEPQNIAELVAEKAQEVGRSETERTPFADAAKEEGYDGHKGGKLDAVTVIVSLDRVRDHGYDNYMEVEKKIRKVIKFHSLILSQPNNTIAISLLDTLARRLGLGFKQHEPGAFLLKFPHVFEIYEHPVQRILYCRLTRKALDQIRHEHEAVLAQIPDVVTRLRKLVMMSNTGRIRLEHVRIARTEFGLPEDFEYSVILKHPQFFRLIDAEETRDKYIEIVEKDPNLSICAIERVREIEYRSKGIDAEDVRFSFVVNFPPGFKIGKYFRIAVWKWQRLPYWSPYEDISGYDLRSMEAQNRLEKRAVACIHELLSLTVEKKITLERIAHFRNVMNLPKKLKEFLLQHQGIFYISTRGNYGKLHTVFLREAYKRGELVVPNDVYLARRRLAELVLMSPRKAKVDAELVSYRNGLDDEDDVE